MMPRSRPTHDATPASVAILMPEEQRRLLARLCAISALTAIAVASAAVAPPVPAQSTQAQQGGSTTQSSGQQLHHSGSGRTQ